MKTFSLTVKGYTITQHQDGIHIGGRQFLPITIESITPSYHYTSFKEYYKTYEINFIETASLFTKISNSLVYIETEPEKLIMEFNSRGIKSDFLPKDFLIIWISIIENAGKLSLMKEPVLCSENCGWILHENELHYMTYKFSISKEGIQFKHHCSNQQAIIPYDKPPLNSREALLDVLKLIDLDFDEIMPIFLTNILSLIAPIVNQFHLYPVPGLYLSGPTSTGKTELTLAFGTLLGYPSTEKAVTYLLLQSGLRELNNCLKGLGDTTFLLDDARNPISQSIKQNINTTIERLTRSTFSKSGNSLTVIVTGEPGLFNSNLTSFKNRFVAVYLDSNEDKMSSRRTVIQKAKKNPDLVRACLIHFIEFLCNINNEKIEKLIAEAKEYFSQETSFAQLRSRNSDNLFMHCFALKLFLYYGKTECMMGMNDIECYEKHYASILKKINDDLIYATEKGRLKFVIEALCSQIKTGLIKIHIPQKRKLCFCNIDDYYNNRSGYNENFTDSYCHEAIIDQDAEYCGVYIAERNGFPTVRTTTHPLPTLVINASTLLSALKQADADFERTHGIKILTLTDNKLKQLLAQYGLLYLEPRYGDGDVEKCRKNYTCKYLHWYNGTITKQSVFLINMTSPYCEELKHCLNTLPKPTVSNNSLYSFAQCPVSRADFSAATDFIAFRQICP